MIDNPYNTAFKGAPTSYVAWFAQALHLHISLPASAILA